jgi:phosphoserine phosphatase RsbU/P
MQVSPPDVPERAVGLDEQGFQWPIAFMCREDFRKGEYLFKIGDRAERLFYILKGQIRLPELNRSVKAGQVIGEMGLFSPSKQRSATAFAEEDVETYTMGGDQVRRLMSRDPELATNLLEVIIKRMMEHLKAEAEARERINAELRIARDIQSSMLPRVFPPFPGRKEFELYAVMEPANEVGGDLYDFFFVDENRLCVLVGDVSGKGVPAALLMALTKTLLRSEATRGYSASEILARVNNALCAENDEGMFVTVFCLLLNTQTGEAEYCTAGHNPPLLCSNDGAAEFLQAEPGSVVGFQENVTYRSSIIHFKRGELLLLYTDGVTEAENPKQELFSEDRFRSCVAALHGQGVRELIDGVKNDLALHTQGHPPSDDLTLLALKYHGPVNKG